MVLVFYFVFSILVGMSYMLQAVHAGVLGPDCRGLEFWFCHIIQLHHLGYVTNHAEYQILCKKMIIRVHDL